MYKYEIIAKEITAYLDQHKNQGAESLTITAKQVEENFCVSQRFGAKQGTRYPLIGQAVHNVSRYRSVVHDGSDPSSTFTMTYYLRK